MRAATPPAQTFLLETKTGVLTMFKWLCPKRLMFKGINNSNNNNNKKKNANVAKSSALLASTLIFSPFCSHGIKSRSQTYLDLQRCDSSHQPLFSKHPLWTFSHLIAGQNKNRTICCILPNSNIQVISDWLWVVSLTEGVFLSDFCTLKTYLQCCHSYAPSHFSCQNSKALILIARPHVAPLSSCHTWERLATWRSFFIYHSHIYSAAIVRR